MTFLVPEHKALASIGDRFDMLTVVGALFYGPDGNRGSRRRQYAVMKCDCGSFVLRPIGEANRGRVSSCGCYCSAHSARLAKTYLTKHGHYGTRLYKIWQGMKWRCNPARANSASHRRYAGRGIAVCDEWVEFEPFKEWAMSNGYRDDLTIDRINNDGNYEPSNCRWADLETQSNNKSVCRTVEAFGEKKTLAQWSRDCRCSIDDGVIALRLSAGWDSEKAISQPAFQQKHHAMPATAFGETKSLMEWSHDSRCVVPYKTLKDRVVRGWDIQTAIASPLVIHQRRTRRKFDG